MFDGLADFLHTADPATIIIAIIILIITGGLGTSFVQARVATKRGISGDALVQESNGITGLTNLGTLQGEFIEKLQVQITDLSNRITDVESKLEDEITYSNLLIQTLSENTIPIPPRQRRKKTL